jgi:hypothetical protein
MLLDATHAECHAAEQHVPARWGQRPLLVPSPSRALRTTEGERRGKPLTSDRVQTAALGSDSENRWHFRVALMVGRLDSWEVAGYAAWRAVERRPPRLVRMPGASSATPLAGEPERRRVRHTVEDLTTIGAIGSVGFPAGDGSFLTCCVWPHGSRLSTACWRSTSPVFAAD